MSGGNGGNGNGGNGHGASQTTTADGPFPFDDDELSDHTLPLEIARSQVAKARMIKMLDRTDGAVEALGRALAPALDVDPQEEIDTCECLPLPG